MGWAGGDGLEGVRWRGSMGWAGGDGLEGVRWRGSMGWAGGDGLEGVGWKEGIDGMGWRGPGVSVLLLIWMVGMQNSVHDSTVHVHVDVCT